MALLQCAMRTIFKLMCTRFYLYFQKLTILASPIYNNVIFPCHPGFQDEPFGRVKMYLPYFFIILKTGNNRQWNFIFSENWNWDQKENQLACQICKLDAVTLKVGSFVGRNFHGFRRFSRDSRNPQKFYPLKCTFWPSTKVNTRENVLFRCMCKSLTKRCKISLKMHKNKGIWTIYLVDCGSLYLRIPLSKASAKVCCRSIARFRIPNLEKWFYTIFAYVANALSNCPSEWHKFHQGDKLFSKTYRGYLASSPGSFHKALPGEERNCPRWKSPGQLARMAETAIFIIYPTSLYGILLIMYLLQDDLEESLSSFRSLWYAGYRQYIWWVYKYLGPKNQCIIPSCVVWKIRQTYPEDSGNYVPFRHADLDWYVISL